MQCKGRSTSSIARVAQINTHETAKQCRRKASARCSCAAVQRLSHWPQPICWKERRCAGKTATVVLRLHTDFSTAVRSFISGCFNDGYSENDKSTHQHPHFSALLLHSGAVQWESPYRHTVIFSQCSCCRIGGLSRSPCAPQLSRTGAILTCQSHLCLAQISKLHGRAWTAIGMLSDF